MILQKNHYSNLVVKSPVNTFFLVHIPTQGLHNMLELNQVLCCLAFVDKVLSSSCSVNKQNPWNIFLVRLVSLCTQTLVVALRHRTYMLPVSKKRLVPYIQNTDKCNWISAWMVIMLLPIIVIISTANQWSSSTWRVKEIATKVRRLKI